MTNIDFDILEDRVNFVGDIQNLANLCLLGNEQSVRAFQLLHKSWDEYSSGQVWYQGHWSDYFRCGSIVLECARKLGDIAVQAKLLNELGWNYMEQEKFEQARQYFDESLEKFQSIKDVVSQCQSLLYLSTLFLRQKRFGSALKCYRQALNLVAVEQTKLPENQRLAHQEAEFHNLLGNLYLNLWNFRTSEQELRMSLSQYRELDAKYFQAAPLLNLGRLYFRQGNYEKARKYYEECQQLCDEINRTDMKGGVLYRLAELARTEGNEEKADQFAKQCEDLSKKEVPSLRNRAAYFRKQVKEKERKSIKLALSRFSQLSWSALDLLTASPMTAIQALNNYISFYLLHKLRRVGQLIVNIFRNC